MKRSTVWLLVLFVSTIGFANCNGDDNDSSSGDADADTDSDTDTDSDSDTDSNTDDAVDTEVVEYDDSDTDQCSMNYEHPAKESFEELCDSSKPCGKNSKCSDKIMASDKYIEHYCHLTCDPDSPNIEFNGGCECDDRCVKLEEDPTTNWCVGMGQFIINDIPVKVMDVKVDIGYGDATFLTADDVEFTADLDEERLRFGRAYAQWVDYDYDDDGEKEQCMNLKFKAYYADDFQWHLDIFIPKDKFVAGGPLSPKSKSDENDINYAVRLGYAKVNAETGIMKQLWNRGYLREDESVLTIDTVGETCPGRPVKDRLNCAPSAFDVDFRFYKFSAKVNPENI
ncbi:MAG: hypothetical protein GY847_05905 [Proteobacteria bacterium]|nr:hypothetical protein [Pseudomonadota bacterium]